MSLRDHAIQELKAIGYNFDPQKTDDVEDLRDFSIQECVLELIDTFANQGHSGSSAAEVRGLFTKLAAYEPLCPLLGTDDEWNEVTNTLYQNRRCSHVFKENGQAYDIDGIIFREPNGCCFTSIKSRVNVEFPYTPKSEYVDVPFDRDVDLL